MGTKKIKINIPRVSNIKIYRRFLGIIFRYQAEDICLISVLQLITYFKDLHIDCTGNCRLYWFWV